MRSNVASARDPLLAGVRVLDFGRFVAGPYCARLLADLGADVVRVERVNGGEDRFTNPLAPDGSGAIFLHVNSNKRSLTLDAGSPDGSEIVRRLVGNADVVVANLPPRALASLSLDYDSLRRAKPDIILTTIDTFGPLGPYSGRVGFDGVGQAMSGSVFLSGEQGHPTKAAAGWADFGTATLAALSTLAAIMRWRETGQGQHVQAALLPTALTFSGVPLLEQAVAHSDRGPIGNQSHLAAPYDICATQDGWVIVQIIGSPIFRRWATLVGEEDWIHDPRFQDDASRAANRAILNTCLANWCAARSTDDALDQLNSARIPAGPVYSPQQALDDPHVRATGFLEPTQYPGLGAIPLTSTPFSMSEEPRLPRLRPPTLGEHTDVILTELGYTTNDIEDLRRRSVV